MAIALMNANIEWDWGTEVNAINKRPIYLLGFNVAICEDWVEQDVIEEKHTYFSKIKGKDKREYTFNSIILEIGTKYKIWVQAEEIGGKSPWVCSSTIEVPGDVRDTSKLATYEDINRISL